MKTTIETNVQIAFEAEKSLISAEAVAHATLAMLYPNSNRIHAKYRQGLTTLAFNLLVRELSLEHERITGKRATVVTRDKGRHGPFLDFVEKYLGAFAREEGLEWPINRDQKANRAALAEKIHRVLYPRKGNKSFTGQAKAAVRGKIQLP